MRSFPVFFLLCLSAMVSFNNTIAQQAVGDWRVAKKTLVTANGQRLTTEYEYSNDGRIQTVRTFSGTGVLTSTTRNFKFDRNNKPTSYVIVYNRESGEINVSLRYDNNGRIVELVKTVSPRDITTYSYRYARSTNIITQAKTEGESSIKDGKITSYSEHGNYEETVSDAASQTITTTITLNQTHNPDLEPWPDNLMGGYEAPIFFGVQAYGNAPEATSIKNSDGLITSLILTTRTSTRKFEYNYTRIGATTDEPEQTGTKIIITTNINCAEGKKQVERLLSTLDGIFSAVVDIRTGKISLDYSPDGTPYAEILTTINNAGFDADKSKTRNASSNPCDTKPANKPVSIRTNGNCAEAKNKIEQLMKAQDGVFSAVVDSKTGVLILDYSTDGTSYAQIIQLLNEAGFHADGKKSFSPDLNPCKTNTPTTTLSIQTNLGCEEGKTKVESLLKRQAGIVNATANIRTGKINIEYRKDLTTADKIARSINTAGYDADKLKTSTPENNPCVKQPDPAGDKPYTVPPPEKIPKEVTASKFSSIKGKLFYRYKKGNESPVSNNLGIGPSFKKIKMGNTTVNVIDAENAYPDVAATQRFPKTNDNETQPLKNAKISLIYTTLSSSRATPSKYEELDNRHIQPYPSDPLYKYWLQNDYAIETVTTDGAGNFSFSFFNNLSLGYLGEFTGYQQKFSDKTYLDLIGKFHLHGTLRIVINEVDFYHPEVLLFPKPGKTIQVPDEVALVNSFDLTVTVRSNPQIWDQALETGLPVSSYPVSIGRLQANLASDVPSTPFEAKQLEKKGITGMIPLGGPYKIFDEDITTGNGIVVFKNLCINNEHQLQALADQYAGSFVYKDQTKYLPPPSGVVTGAEAPGKFTNYNSKLVIQQKTTEMLVSPKLPEIYVTVQTRSNGKIEPIAGADVTLYNYYKAVDGKKEEYITQKLTTDPQGHLQIKDLPVQLTKELVEKNKVDRVIGPVRSLMFNKPGYYTKMLPTTIAGQVLQWGQRWPGGILEMKGTAKLIGRVENEKGKSIAAEIRVAEGPSVKTKSFLDGHGFIDIDNCVAGNKISVQINPSAGDHYFSETIIVDIPPGKTTDLGRIKLKERLHRAIFKVVDQNNKPVNNATITINSSTSAYTTGKDGLSGTVEIASPVENFSVNIKAASFLPYDDYVSIPNSKEPKKITISLVKGTLISGYVKDGETKQAIANARVYTITAYNEDGAVEVETYTDDKGYYELEGVSKPGYFLNPGTNKLSSGQVTVYAVKSGQPGYVQAQRTVKTDNATDVNFELQRLNCNSEIWGLPVEIISVEKKPTGFVISGVFIKLPANGTFKALENAKIPFKNVKIAIKSTGIAGEKCSMEPLENSITTELSELKIIAFDKFNCELTGLPRGRGYENLVISKSKTGNCGLLSGFVKSELESFNFSYDYSGRFLFQPFIAKPTLQNTIGKNVMIDVFGAGSCAAVKDKYSLSPEENNTSFSIHNFKASIRKWDSYIVRDTFSLGTDIEINIPLVKDKTLNAGAIKVMQKDILPPDFKGQINIAIEKWTITGSGLVYMNEQGGFKIKDAVLQTNLPALPLKSLIITPTNLDPGQDNVDPSKEVTLAGVAPLTLNNASPSLTLEQSAPHDHKQHWRLNLYNTKKAPVAYLQNIPGLATDDKIAINLFINYSDGVKKLVLDGAPHMFYNVVQQTIENIEVGSDYFTLIGNTDLKIPNNNTNITGRFKYMKRNDSTVFIAEKLNTDVELNGKVSFNGSQVLTTAEIKKGITNFTISEGYFLAKGTANIYETDKNKGTDVSLPAYMIKENGAIRMELQKDQEFPLPASKQKMIVTAGKADVIDGYWSNLKFVTRLTGYDVISDPAKAILAFEVKGAIEADPSASKLELDGINTPFGDLKLIFDFAKKSFNGNVHFENAGIVIPPGLFTLNTGDAEVQLDSKGFIIAGAFSDVSFNPVPILNPFQCGMALGVYTGPLPASMVNKLRNVSVLHTIPPSLETGLIGAYISVSKTDHRAITVPLLNTPKAEVNIDLEIRTIVNLNKGCATFVAEGYGNMSAGASLTLPLPVPPWECINSVSGKSDIYMKFGYSCDTGLSLFGDAAIKVGVTACNIEVGPLTLGLKVGVENGVFTFNPHF